MTMPPLCSFRAENFKAIRDSRRVDFGWLTVFIGNNGVGKSSLVGALETYRDVVLEGVDDAFRRWRGFEHALNKSHKRSLKQSQVGRAKFTQPMKFRSHWRWQGKELRCQQTINQGENDALFIEQEQIIQRRTNRTERWTRNDAGEVHFQGERPTERPEITRMPKLADGESVLKQFAWESFDRWQFVMLNADRMGQPTPQQRASGAVRLARDGANIAEYLNDLRQRDLAAFDGLLDTLRYVLPYACDLQPKLTSELERAFYLKLTEQSFGIPGWLLSTGTLRIVALLACLRHPDPPAVLVIEELENGLDPRTLHLVVEEIRAAMAAGSTQVIATTHSPFLLDLLDLSHIVAVDRVDGQPIFVRPDEKELTEWSKSFSPGRLYTMGRLTRSKS